MSDPEGITLTRKNQALSRTVKQAKAIRQRSESLRAQSEALKHEAQRLRRQEQAAAPLTTTLNRRTKDSTG